VDPHEGGAALAVPESTAAGFEIETGVASGTVDTVGPDSELPVPAVSGPAACTWAVDESRLGSEASAGGAMGAVMGEAPGSAVGVGIAVGPGAVVGDRDCRCSCLWRGNRVHPGGKVMP